MSSAVRCVGCKHWREFWSGEVPDPSAFRWHTGRSGLVYNFVCLKKHRPRFYWYDSSRTRGDWKRRCSDYDGRDDT